jgi:hypothetical protein
MTKSQVPSCHGLSVCKSRKKKTMMMRLFIIMALGFVAMERRSLQQERIEVLVIITMGCATWERRRVR